MLRVGRDFQRRLAQLRLDLRDEILKAGGYDVVADKIGCTREALSNLTGQAEKRPSLEMAKALQDLFPAIRMERWADQYRFRPRGCAA